MSRAALATAFLDTFLVNAHTTAMDVAWACLPSVTLSHERFASRVGASVQSALGCVQTLARNVQDYQDIAIKLGRSKVAAKIAKTCLEIGKDRARLWDTRRWVKDWERAMKLLCQVRGSHSQEDAADMHIIPVRI